MPPSGFASPATLPPPALGAFNLDGRGLMSPPINNSRMLPSSQPALHGPRSGAPWPGFALMGLDHGETLKRETQTVLSLLA